MGRKRHAERPEGEGPPASSGDGALAGGLPGFPGLLGVPGLPAGSNPVVSGLAALLHSSVQLAASQHCGAMDPDVLELCEHFDLEERHRQELNELMKQRKDSFAEDMDRLWEELGRAINPTGLLVSYLRQMERGTFIGKAPVDKELAGISKRYKLDGQAESKLADTLRRHEEEVRNAYLAEIDQHLAASNHPSSRAMMLLKKLGSGQPLGKPGPPAPGSYLDNKNKEAEREKERDKERDRERDRGRRSPDRGGGRDRDRRDDDRGGGGGRDRGRRGDSRDRSRRSRSRRR